MFADITCSQLKSQEVTRRVEKNPSEANKKKYITYRNKFKTLKTIAQKTYYQNEFEKYTHDIKKTWRVIKSTINGHQSRSIIDVLRMDEKVITDPREIAQQLNRFFSGIGQSLAEKI